jgi:Ca-activated chloride channel family protein
MRLRGGTALGSLLTAVVAAAQSDPPRRPPTFGAGVEVIRLSVSVTDGRNRLVSGLSDKDFAVFEDGVRQELAFFTDEAPPLSVALLLDCSASMAEKLPVAKEAGVRFVRSLAPKDLGQVVQFNDRITVLQDFTHDHGALEAAIGSASASGPTVLHNALYITLKELLSHGTPAAPRRRAVVLLSDGEDTASLVTDDQVLELARQAEIGVYAIGLRPDRVQDRQRLAFSQATHFLTALARETGGQIYLPASLSELDAVYGRVADELRTQYTLGYLPQNGRRDGRWRRIVVRTVAREDVQVRHKVGYYGPRG